MSVLLLAEKVPLEPLGRFLTRQRSHSSHSRNFTHAAVESDRIIYRRIVPSTCERLSTVATSAEQRAMRRTLSATLFSVLALVAAGSEVFRGFQAHLSDAAQFGTESGIARFELPSSGLTLRRASKAGAFLDVVGRRSAFLGYEHRGLEAWVYPLKLFDDLQVAFTLAGYPLDVAGRDVLTHIEARPESTVLTYSHAAFTVRQVLAAPIDEPALVMLLDVETTLPLGIRISFRPRLRLGSRRATSVGTSRDGSTS
jgi:hypothetical protein